MSYDQRIIIMAKRDDPFARVSKAMLDNAQLSWRAKGVLSYLLGKPSGWKLRVSDLCAKASEGRNATLRALRELRATGYADFYRTRIKGLFQEGLWKISDSPIFPPQSKNPPVDSSPVKNPPD